MQLQNAKVMLQDDAKKKQATFDRQVKKTERIEKQQKKAKEVEQENKKTIDFLTE